MFTFFLNLKAGGRVRLFKFMGISQPCTGSWAYFKDLWWKAWTSAVESTQRMTDFISYLVSFSAAKERHTSVVCPCCLLGKEYLSSSDRCWHYHPCVLRGTGTRPVHKHGLTGARARRQRQTAAHRFWMSKMATLILAGAEDDVVIMVLIHTASQKNWFLLSTHCQRHTKRKENWQA